MDKTPLQDPRLRGGTGRDAGPGPRPLLRAAPAGLRGDGGAAAREALRALLERYSAIEAGNAELRRRFESLPAEARLLNIRRRLALIKDWLDAQTGPLARTAAAADAPGAAVARGRFRAAARAAAWTLGLSAAAAALYFAVPAEIRPPLPGLPAGKALLSPRGPAPLAVWELDAAGRKIAPAARLTGLARHNGRWLSVDWADGRLFELDPGAGARFLRGFPNSFTSGLSAGADGLWSLDAFNRRCYSHDPATFAVLASFAAPGPSPSAVHWDGGALWLADRRTRRAYRYANLRRGPVALTEHRLLETDPAGLWLAGGLLWVLDRAGKTVRRYGPAGDGRLAPRDALQLSAWLPAGARPSAMAIADGELWILTENPCLLYRRGLEGLDWETEADVGG